MLSENVDNLKKDYQKNAEKRNVQQSVSLYCSGIHF